MSKDKRFKIPEKVSRLVSSENWKDPKFNFEKAYVCAFFSRMAYWQIADFEVKGAKRANIIPCADFQEIIHFPSADRPDISEILIGREEFRSFKIIRRNVVILGVVTPRVVVISMRGTVKKHLEDIKADLYLFRNPLKRKRFKGNRFDYHNYHPGFLDSTIDIIPALLSELDNMNCLGGSVPIYLTGHSLGGAIAGTLYTICSRNLRYRIPYSIYCRELAQNLSPASNIFGTPRYYKNRNLFTGEPIHIYNPQDVVPQLPPRNLGFLSPADEYDTWGNHHANIPTKEYKRNFLDVFFRAQKPTAVLAHSIDLYEKYMDELSNG